MIVPPSPFDADRSAVVADEIAKATHKLHHQLSKPRELLSEIYEDWDYDFSGGHRPPVRHRVLFLGPPTYREAVWDTRAKYIIPDLFECLGSDAQIGMLLPPPPEFAAPLLKELTEQFRVKTFFTGVQQNGQRGPEYWTDQLYQTCELFRPTVVSNFFSAMLLGYAAGILRTQFGFRSVVRFAGDEIGARVAMGKYVPGDPQHTGDVRNELVATHLADAIISMSPWEQKRLSGCVQDPSKVHVCIRGIDLNRFAPPATARAWPPKNVLFVGRKSQEKGYDIVESCANILTHNSDVQFWFAGTFDRETIGNKHYLGFVQPEDLPALYQRMDVLVLTSRTEGFPQVVPEAMATGLPTILSRHLFEGLLRHRNDTMLTGLTPDDLLLQLTELRSNQELCDRVSRNGAEYARKHFDRRAWKQVYRSIVIGEPMDRSGPEFASVTT
jgi:glycosyltransferase involved in cell wall biosynthesis